MKNFIILLIALFSCGIINAQDNYPYVRHNNQYIATYAYGSLWGMNGFRSVEEENRIMEQNLAELKRQRDLEEMTPEEREKMRRNRQIKLEIKNEALQAKREKEDSRKTKKVAKSDSASTPKKVASPAAPAKAAPATATKDAAKPVQPVAVKKEESKKKK